MWTKPHYTWLNIDCHKAVFKWASYDYTHCMLNLFSAEIDITLSQG